MTLKKININFIVLDGTPKTYLKFPLVSNRNIAQLRAFEIGRQCHHVLWAPKFPYRAEMGRRVFFYYGHMIVQRKITTWQRCENQFSFPPDSINQLTVGVRHVKYGAEILSYLHMRENLL